MISSALAQLRDLHILVRLELSNILRRPLKRLYVSLSQLSMLLYNRRISFGDLILDRWERASLYGFGSGSSVYDSVLVLGDVTIGDNCWIGPNVILDGSGAPLTVGNNTTISAGVHIYTHSTHLRDVDGDMSGVLTGPVNIGCHCYLGPSSIISLGTSISDHVVVGALSFVNGLNVPKWARVYGIPAHIYSIKGDA